MSVTLYTPDLSKIIHETKVDFRQRVIQPIIHIVQYDKSLPIIAVKLYNNGIAYALPENADVSVRWGKRDHTFVYNAVLGCNSDRTIVYFEITEQMTVFYGEHNPIIELRNGTSLAGSGYIPFYLDRNPIQLGDVESQAESGILSGMIIKLISITYSDLVSLRDSASLVPGQQYRITDYMTTTVQANTQSAGHPFDIIVTADSIDKLNENARACLHDGDTYFANSKLEAWKLKYCLDNDTSRFAWAKAEFAGCLLLTSSGPSSQLYAPIGTVFEVGTRLYTNKECSNLSSLTVYSIDEDTGNPTYYQYGRTYVMSPTTISPYPDGRGVIYHLIDEFNNDVPYDFKNIQFKKADVWYHTFTDDLVGNSYNNKIGVYISSNKATLNANTFGTGCYSNTFGNSCSSNTFGNSCDSNTFGDGCYSNTFGNSCDSNTFGNGCTSNTFGNGCYSNTFGNSCRSNTFGTNCYHNTFGDNCRSNTFGDTCYNNTFGDTCYNNTFGTTYYSNTFGNTCYSNTFGTSCQHNTFGNTCYSNAFGDGCSRNIFGNYCASNTFGNSYQSNTFGSSGSNNTFGDTCYDNTFGSGCQYNTFGHYYHSSTFGNNCYRNTFGNYCNSNTFGNACVYLKISDSTSTQKKYIHVENGTSGASSANQFDLYDAAILNKDYQITFKKSASGKYLMLWATDTGAMTGKVKDSIIDTTWEDIEQIIEGGIY